jgi:hypothetical protein
MINVILALELSVAQKLKQNLTRINTGTEEDPVWEWERNDMTNAQRKKLRYVYESKFGRATAGGDTYIGLNFYFPDLTVGEKQDPPTDDMKLWWLEKLKELLPGKEFVGGAWYGPTHKDKITSDGKSVQYGQSITRATYDENGNEVTPELITGTPVYPQHAQLIKLMPDDVVYDENGDEVSRI